MRGHNICFDDISEINSRALEKRENLMDDDFSYFSSKPYVLTPHLNRLTETVQMRGHNICFYEHLQKLSLITPKYSLLS